MLLRAAGTRAQEPEESGGPDEQGYQPGEPAGSHRAVRGGEAGFAPGEEACPATTRRKTTTRRRANTTRDRATDSSRATASKVTASKVTGREPARSRASGQDRVPGRWSATGNGPRTSSGSVPGRRTPSARVPRVAWAPGPLSSPPAQRPQATPSPLDAPGTFGSLPSGPQRPLSSGPQDPLSSGPRRAIGSASAGIAGYGEETTGAYRQYGADDPSRSGWSDAGDQPGYASQQGYGDRPSYGDQPSYSDQPGYGSPGLRGPGWLRPGPWRRAGLRADVPAGPRLRPEQLHPERPGWPARF